MAVTRSVNWLRHAHAFLLGLRDDSRKTFVAYQRAALRVGPAHPRASEPAPRRSEAGESSLREWVIEREEPWG